MKQLPTFFTKNKSQALFALLLLILIITTFTLRANNSQQKQPVESIPSPTPEIALTPGKDYVIGQTTVKFKKDIPPAVIDEKLRQYNARIIDRIEALNVVVLEVPAGKEQEIADKLQQDGIVEYAEINHIYEEHQYTANDPMISSQWGLTKIQAQQAWNITRGTGIVVAAIQNGGAEISHPDLAPNIVPGSGGAGTAAHGTNLAGSITAATNNGIGIAGTCPECKLIMFNVNGYTDANIAQSIIGAADRGAKAVNMSFGGPDGGTVIEDAVNYAWNKGTISVASAGNDNVSSLSYPASYAKVVSVGATAQNDIKSSFSNYGTWVKVTAPGSNITTTHTNGTYKSVSGTSFSAPITTGVIGLIWSTPYGTSPQAVVDRLCSTSDKISGTGSQFSCGRINAFKAVQGNPPTVVPTKAPTAVPTAIPKPTIAPTTVPQPTLPPAEVTPTKPLPLPTFACLGGCITPEPSVNTPTEPESEAPIEPQPIPQPAPQPQPANGGLLQILILLIQLIIEVLRR